MGDSSSNILSVFFCFVTTVLGCNDPPTIPNAFFRSSDVPPFTNGTTITYSCKDGYTGNGIDVYTCLNQAWQGDFECLRVCKFIDGLENGDIVNRPSFIVGSRITFECNPGYKMVGSSSLLCRYDRTWRPDQPTCEIVKCGDFGNVANAEIYQKNLDGTQNVYGSQIQVTCHEGYILQGPSVISCQADGQWELQPMCKQSVCGSHAGSSSACIYDTSLSDDGSLLSFLCQEDSSDVSVTKVGSGNTICTDSKWDEPDMACYCDCKIKANFTEVVARNLEENNFLKHGKKLNWRCKAGYKKENGGDIICSDGKAETPQCVLPATLPTNDVMYNVTIPGKPDSGTDTGTDTDTSRQIPVTTTGTQPQELETKWKVLIGVIGFVLLVIIIVLIVCCCIGKLPCQRKKVVKVPVETVDEVEEEKIAMV